jgi:hypothetical protein
LRFTQGYRRSFEHPDRLLDEAETSLNASFNAGLSFKDKEDLVEDARDRTIDWLQDARSRGEKNANRT